MDYMPLGLCLILCVFSSVSPAGSISPPLFLTALIKQNKIGDAIKLSAVNSSLFLNVTSYSAVPISPARSISPPLFLTALIKQNKLGDARKLSEVNSSLFLNVTSHSGFLTVDERYNSNTFFWYFPVPKKPVNATPWVIWLQGGPGASSLVGLFDEIGPFAYEQEKGLKLRNSAWARDYSMLFIDNPVGSGYSFTEHDDGYAQNKTTYSNNLFVAVQQILLVFPELRKAPLFIGGESYAGRYATALATNILETGPPLIDVNLQGLILGNPILNVEDTANYSALFHQWGLIDSQGVLAIKALQDQYVTAIGSSNSLLAYQLNNQLLSKLQEMTSQKQLYNVLADDYQLGGFADFLDSEEIRTAIHVGDRNFTFENITVTEKLAPDFLDNVQLDMEKLLEHYRVLIYCGQLDLKSSCVQNSEARRDKWHWSLASEFMKAPRVPWWHNETLAGYDKTGGRLSEVLVIGAGHLVPVEKPAQTLTLISTFINDKNTEPAPNTANPHVTTDKAELLRQLTFKNTSTIAPVLKNNVTNVQNATTNSTNLVPDTTILLPTNQNRTTSSTVTPTTKNYTTDSTNIVLNPTSAPKNQDQNATNKTAPENTKESNTSENKTTDDNKTTVEYKTNGKNTTNEENKTTVEYKTNGENKTNAAEELKQPTNENSTSSGTIISIVVNVLLVVVVIVGALLYCRHRRRTADFFYSNVETNSDDIFLT